MQPETIKKSLELDNIIKNIYMEVNADITFKLLMQQQIPLASLGIIIPEEKDLINQLYNYLAKYKQQQFFFILPIDNNLSAETVENIGRFFFLTNYCLKKDSPKIGYKKPITYESRDALNYWCKEQDFGEPAFQSVEIFNGDDSDIGEFVYVTQEQHELFLAFLLEKIVKLEWLNQKIIFHIPGEECAESLMAAVYGLSKQLKEKNAGVYTVLSTLVRLENELRRSETIIQFQEIEINNQKLYNRLIRGAASEHDFTPNSHPNPSLNADIVKLKENYSKLLMDIGRLRNEIAWYKRTYEERSLLGTIKEKVLRRIRQK